MDILIKTSDDSEVNRWNGPPGKVPIPGTGDVVFPGDSPRPIDIGPDHFLATATVVDEPVGDSQKRGPETVEVVGQEVTVTRTTIAKTAEDILTDWKGTMSDTDRESMPRITEDIIDSMDAAQMSLLPQIVRDRHADKKSAREAKP
jgi:hypothetical protein